MGFRKTLALLLSAFMLLTAFTACKKDEEKELYKAETFDDFTAAIARSTKGSYKNILTSEYVSDTKIEADGKKSSFKLTVKLSSLTELYINGDNVEYYNKNTSTNTISDSSDTTTLPNDEVKSETLYYYKDGKIYAMEGDTKAYTEKTATEFKSETLGNSAEIGFTEQEISDFAITKDGDDFLVSFKVTEDGCKKLSEKVLNSLEGYTFSDVALNAVINKDGALVSEEITFKSSYKSDEQDITVSGKLTSSYSDIGTLSKVTAPGGLDEYVNTYVAPETVLHSLIATKYNLADFVSAFDISKLTVSEAVINAAVEQDRKNFLNTYGTLEEYTDGTAAKTGDTLMIHFTGSAHDSSVVLTEATLANMTNVSTEGGSAAVIGSNSYITAYSSTEHPEKNNPGFEDQLIGHKKGETFVITVTFPDNYGTKELAGVVVDFSITVISVSHIKETEITEELLKANTGYATVADYEKEAYDYYRNYNAYENVIASIKVTDFPDETITDENVCVEYLAELLKVELTQAKYEELMKEHYEYYAYQYYMYYGISTIEEFEKAMTKETLIINFHKNLVMEAVGAAATVVKE